MCDALRKLMAPEIEEEVQKAVQKATDNYLTGVAERMIRDGKLDDQEIMDITGLTAEQVRKIKEKMLPVAE